MGWAWGAAGSAPAAEALQPDAGMGGRENICCQKHPSGETQSVSENMKTFSLAHVSEVWT